MNVVGIDVSKGKSMVAVLSPGESLIDPFEIIHDIEGFGLLRKTIGRLPGETRVVMENTGNHHILLAENLTANGIFVSVINPKRIHDFGNNSIRKVKNDRHDAIRICNYGAVYWDELQRYQPLENTREDLRKLERQRVNMLKIQTILNNQLISVTDIVFPGINGLLDSAKEDGSRKWVDFMAHYHSAETVAKRKLEDFRESYHGFCRRNGYRYTQSKADEIHCQATEVASGKGKSEAARMMLDIYARQLQEINRSVVQISDKMHELSESLPEYGIVMEMYGVGNNFGPQLMAEIGDVRRFHSKKALVAFAGIDPPPFQSGKFESRSRRISKRGPSQLRKTLFQIMKVYVANSAEDQDVYRFIRKKILEGKHFFSALVAGSNKFLRQYYSKVRDALDPIEET